MTIELDKLFAPQNKSVLDFFRVAGVGYLIPEYQREYSWDKENIDQLLKDISLGVERLTDKNFAEQEIRFLGTVITVTENNSKNKDPKGTPTRIDMIIDGQQRIITISIMTSLFIKILTKLLSLINEKSDIYEDVEETVGLWNERIIDCISFDMSIGKPRLKPRLIRGGHDYWTAYDKIEIAYTSEISKYESQFINTYLDSKNDPKVEFPIIAGQDIYAQNYRRIEKWLKTVVGKAHTNDNDDFPTAKLILDNVPQTLLWHTDRPKLKDIVDKHFAGFITKESDAVCTLVQTVSACYYLLERCCFCVIRPTNEDWAFDMFQSLNATGTPLTALETFKPVVVNYLKNNNIDYKGTVTEHYFHKVEKFLGEPTTAVGKTKRTNDFIISFFVAYNGEKVPTHFSGERRALVDNYNKLSTDSLKEAFIKKMGDYSEFYDLWLDHDEKKLFKLNGMHEETELVSLLVLFLKKANHKMAITTLGTIYQEVLSNSSEGDKNFIDAVKATTAFYFLWKTAFSNNGLDVAYRKFFQNCYKKGKRVDVKAIKEYFTDEISSKIRKNEWKLKAGQNLKYGKLSNDFIRLSLLIASTDTIPDPAIKGMLKLSKPGTVDYLRLKSWNSENLKTIEHVAPQSNNGTWDEALYDQDTTYVNSLGNLTLLPVAINSSAGNKGISEKLLYYKSVGETDQTELNKIESKAKVLGVTLSSVTVKLLTQCNYSHHILPISSLDFCDTWKADIVKKRTNFILDIIWDRMISWLQD